MNRLRTGEWIAGLGAAGLFVSLFLNWFALDGHALGWTSYAPLSSGVHLSGWGSLGWFMDVLLCIAIIGGLSLSYMTVKRTSPAWPIGAGVLTVGIGAAIALALALRLLDLAGDTSFGHDKLIVAVQLPAYLGLLFTILIPVGGFLSLKDERTDAPEARAYTPPPARPAPGT